MYKYSNINDKIIQNDSHFANRRNSYKKSDDDDWFYDFSFLADEEHRNDDEHYWFHVCDVLDFDKLSDAMKYLQKVNSYLVKIGKGNYDEEKFPEFFAARETLIVERLKKELQR
ncbi:MAG: hypothetical protein LBU32_16715 [Clostridiales bacterium]|jgi:transposase-like protein|nr:hypothetical protein [Clostridiales bacterium]